jgi:hypothetical protein
VYFSTYDSDGGTAISFSNEERPDILAQFKPEDLPPDEWIVEKFRVMFDVTELESREYLTQLKSSIRNSQGTSGTITIKKGLNYPALYSNLKATSIDLMIFLDWIRFIQNFFNSILVSDYYFH